jgi:two-component system, OmpR family, phosphate regulon sensor histidine kinase PhoR
MNKKKFHLILLVFTILSLAILIGIQINWMLKSARMQEMQFKYAVSIVMNKAMEQLSNDKTICEDLYNCLSDEKAQFCVFFSRNQHVFSGLDSLIRKELKNFDIDLNFEFDLVEKGIISTCPSTKNVFFHEDMKSYFPESDYELSIRFPEKNDFIRAQMGSIFISSIALLILVSVSITLIYKLLEHERKLSRNIIDFVNNITHEIKTPITNIALASKIISKHKSIESDEKLSAYTKVIINENRSLKEKVDVMLKATLIESGIPFEITEFNILEEIRNVANTFAVQVSEKNGSINLHKSGEDFMISGSMDMFRIAIGNLIDNAIKYNNNSPEIIINIVSKANVLKITVSDNGKGIPQKDISRIFDKYFRVNNGNRHDTDGFGLGLFFVKSIINKMKGNITVTSKVNKGSTFTVKLPVACN